MSLRLLLIKQLESVCFNPSNLGIAGFHLVLTAIIPCVPQGSKTQLLAKRGGKISIAGRESDRIGGQLRLKHAYGLVCTPFSQSQQNPGRNAEIRGMLLGKKSVRVVIEQPERVCLPGAFQMGDKNHQLLKR